MKLETVLKTVIKLAAVMLTSPATWAVAGGLYSDPVQRLIVQIAALVLVEGALLLGWHLLDTNRQAETPQRWLYACMALVAYAGLWWLAVAHGEGLSGIVFRGTLGVLLVYSIADAGLLASIRSATAADRDIMKDGQVRRYARKLARQDAIANLDSDQDIKRQEREAAAHIRGARVALEKQRGLAAVKSEHTASIEQRFPMPIAETRARRDIRRAKSKDNAKATIVRAIGVNPALTHDDLAVMTGKSRQSIGAYLAEMQQAGELTKLADGTYSLASVGNGNGHAIHG